MKTLKITTFIMIVGSTSLIPEGFAASSGLSFLKLGISGRGVAMADAVVALATGPEATHYNPAGLLSRSPGSSAEIMVMHKEWIEDTRTEFLGAMVALDDVQALGLSVNSTSVSDIEIRTRPGLAEGTFTARNYYLGLSYARIVSDEIQAGVTGKFLYEKILIDEASGFGLDLGLRYHTPLQNLTLGATAANLGSMSNLRNESTSLPSLLRVGGAYRIPLDEVHSNAVITSDYVLLFNEGSSVLSAGGEIDFENTIAARAGYTFGSEARKLSTGLGVKYGFLQLDYAYAPLAEDLGNTHTVSLRIEL